MSKFVGSCSLAKIFYLILCSVFGLTFLKLFATSNYNYYYYDCYQKQPLPYPLHVKTSERNFINEKNQSQNLPNTLTKQNPNSNLTISEAVTEIERNMLTSSVPKYQYSQTKSNKIENGKRRTKDRRTVFILTERRSGSTFFGEAMSQHPDIFYHFEPLVFYGNTYFESGLELEQVRPHLKNLAECKYENVDRSMIDLEKIPYSFLGKNPKIVDQCSRLADSCFSPDFLNPACRLFPTQLMKTTRLHGKAGRWLLHEFKDSNPHLIYLFRDPRAIWSSRLKESWCRNKTSSGIGRVRHCLDLPLLCQTLTVDLAEMQWLQSKSEYSKQVQFIKYEDVALNPTPIFKQTFQKLGMSWNEKIDEYLKTHTNINANPQTSTFKNKRPVPFSLNTFRVSKERVFKWQTELNWADVDEIQNKCRDFMTQLGYPFFNSMNFNVTVEVK